MPIPKTIKRPAKAPALAAASPSARHALVLQGGGALGAYQAGAYEALTEARRTPQWIAGISIGAVNAALIAGNPPEQGVQRLREFWELVSSGLAQRMPTWIGPRELFNDWSALMGAMWGIPGFFEPRHSYAFWLGGASPVLSFYDTAPLRATLERLVDFDRINAGETRVSIGAVNVRSGNSVYFDNAYGRIGPEHIMASGALPPGFPPVQIDGESYWDGGLLSNTPLQYVLDSHPRNERLVVLQVDLFSARGAVPRTLSEVLDRQKDITYSSRTRLNTDALAANLNLQQSFADLLAKLPAALRADPSVAAVQAQLRCEPIEIYHLIYRNKPYELESKDYEFSRITVEEHWQAGLHDMRTILTQPEALRAGTDRLNGVTTYDLSEPGAPRVRHLMAHPADTVDKQHPLI
ncbi:MAG: patatin-like phospholipase family protein [Burkholderiaceae bacterium]|jgi:NTE family protein|nr:patatin-like phospholipase family protein [Burkholderiaceae bacterium]